MIAAVADSTSCVALEESPLQSPTRQRLPLVARATEGRSRLRHGGESLHQSRRPWQPVESYGRGRRHYRMLHASPHSPPVKMIRGACRPRRARSSVGRALGPHAREVIPVRAVTGSKEDREQRVADRLPTKTAPSLRRRREQASGGPGRLTLAAVALTLLPFAAACGDRS